MIKEYKIKDCDTIQHIAEQFYKDASQWTTIVIHNQLDYPFITDNLNYETEIRASGYITFEVSEQKDYPITIPKDTIVCVPNTDKKYKVVYNSVLPSKTLSVDVYVECLFPGFWGNIGIGEITEIDALTPISELSVINNVPLINGIVYNIKKTGETLLIPLANTKEENIIYDEITNGEDIFLNLGDFESDKYGDVTSIAGISNIMYALKDRLSIEKGELPYHPKYGLNLDPIIGKNEPYATKLIELEVKETILQDNRIEDVTAISVIKLHTENIVECEVKIKGIEIIQKLSVSIERG